MLSYKPSDRLAGEAKFRFKLRGPDSEQALVLWKRKGKRAFEVEAGRTMGIEKLCNSDRSTC